MLLLFSSAKRYEHRMYKRIQKSLNLGLFLLVAGAGAAVSDSLAQDTPQPQQAFDEWLVDLTAEAKARGISEETLTLAFAGVKPVPRVIELDRRQPEFTQTFWRYLDTRVSDSRIEQGRTLLRTHGPLLREIEQKYGVQGRFLVAFWGLETNFGQYLGGFKVIDALATLAHDPRRSAFFRTQLFDALGIIDDGHIQPGAMMGSWAGAMGQPQFMPSTFARHAVDENGDGRKDIWDTLPDVFGSAANYLSALGWDNEFTWGREVKLPEHFDLDLANLRTKKSLSEWQQLGVRRIDGRDLPNVEIQGAVILPAGYRGPAFLVYSNFDAIMSWNRSLLYAISVGHLADRLAGLGRLQSPRNAEEPLSRTDVEVMQAALNGLGFDAGEPDGQAGPRTRAAVRAFQKDRGLPADGYADKRVFDTITAAAQNAGQSNASDQGASD